MDVKTGINHQIIWLGWLGSVSQTMCERRPQITVSENTGDVVSTCAHQYFTLRRHWRCQASQQDLSAALWEGVWFPHTSLLTQGSLTVTYARGDRNVREKICVSAHISSVLLPWNTITCETERNPWPRTYSTPKTHRSGINIQLQEETLLHAVSL